MPNKPIKPIMSDAKAESWIRRILDWGPWGCSWLFGAIAVAAGIGVGAWCLLR